MGTRTRKRIKIKEVHTNIFLVFDPRTDDPLGHVRYSEMHEEWHLYDADNHPLHGIYKSRATAVRELVARCIAFENLRGQGAIV